MWGSRFTGIGQYLHSIGQYLFENMPDIEWIVLTTDIHRPEFEQYPQVKFINAPQKIYSLSEQTSFCRLLNDQKADLYFFPHFNVPLRFKGRFVCTLHDLTILYHQGKKLKRLWHRMAYKATLQHVLQKSQKVVAVSQATKNEILQHYPQIDAEKITVIQNGLDQKKWQNINLYEREECHKKYGYYFLICGVWREHKNIPRAIEAFNLYRQQGGQSNLVITGKPDPNYPEVLEHAKKSSFTQHIFLPGFVPESEMPALFVSAQALFFPSLSEGFGLPALEAMAAHIPVIASNATSLPEVCGDAASLIDPYNIELMAASLQQVEQVSVREDMIQRGKERIKFFSWQKSAKEHQKIFADLL